MQTEAAVLRELNRRGASRPSSCDPPKAGEVLVKIHASGMCHSDEHLVTGDMPVPLPIIGGHEGAGVVVEVGTGVSSAGARRPRRVRFVPSCGQCPLLASGHSNLCDIGGNVTGPAGSSGRDRRHHGANGEDIDLTIGVPRHVRPPHGRQRGVAASRSTRHRRSSWPACWAAASPRVGARRSTPVR